MQQWHQTYETPHHGAIFANDVLLLTKAAIVNVTTEMPSNAARIVCTIPAFFTPRIFNIPNKINIPIASNISPSQTSYLPPDNATPILKYLLIHLSHRQLDQFSRIHWNICQISHYQKPSTNICRISAKAHLGKSKSAACIWILLHQVPLPIHV